MGNQLPHSKDLEWLLCVGEAALGVNSSLHAQLEAIQRGGSGGVPSDLPHAIAAIDRWEREMPGERWARLQAAWVLVPPTHQQVLHAHYCGALPADDGSGRTRWPKGVHAAFGPLTGVALWLATQEGRLDEIIGLCAKGKTTKLASLIEAATLTCEGAHETWSDALRAARSNTPKRHQKRPTKAERHLQALRDADSRSRPR